MMRHGIGWQASVVMITTLTVPGAMDSAAHAQCVMQKLQAPGDGDWFGRRVAVSLDTLAVSDLVSTGVFNDQQVGIVYVYRLVDQGGGGTWNLESTISAPMQPVAEESVYFGSDIDLDGDTMVVGDIYDDDACVGDTLCESGAAYVFKRDPVNSIVWNQVRKLTAPDATSGDEFGTAVAIDEDIIAIGIDDSAYGEIKYGAVYVFQRDAGGPGNWGFVTKLTAFDAHDQDHFGIDLALEGDTLVVRSLDQDGITSLDNFGAVYVFQRNQGGADNWGLVNKLTASDRYLHQGFAYGGVSLSGDTLAVGASGDGLTCQGDESQCGSVYIFERNAGGPDNWGEVRKLTASDVGDDTRFGYVALSGDRLLVGAPGMLNEICLTAEPWQYCIPGGSYLFDRNVGGAGSWSEVARLQPDDIELLSQIGFQPVLEGDRAFAVAAGDSSGPGRGAVYAFLFDTCDCASDGNHDRTVNIVDLLDLLTVWGACAAPCPPDVEGDGAVSITDLLELLSAWGDCP